MQPTQPFEEILAALAEQDDELDGLLAGLDEPGWARPSRCDGWSISDVVLHLAQTAEMTVASVERRFDSVTASFGNRVAPAGATVDDL
ncbi:MAG TPA: maleylpyruvate isomerase N-terminal domain-containing protein, partial [Acidimicrobiia bacterium]